MSKLTSALLKNINYQKVKKKRSKNFLIYFNELNNLNELKIEKPKKLIAPLCYPFKTKNYPRIKSILLEKNVYIPIYWNDYFNEERENRILFLPLDQRYSKKEINFIINIIKNEY